MADGDRDAFVMTRRSHSGAPMGECGNCHEQHGTPIHCRDPRRCIHGYSRKRMLAWAKQNPDFGRGRKKEEIVDA